MRDRTENILEYAAPMASERYTHYLFRYPAKFHPPVARALLERHTEPGACVLDCFCGSGTLLVEAAISGRSAIGSDIDPVAAFVSRAVAVAHLSEHAQLAVQQERELVAGAWKSSAASRSSQ
jgi:23S rRNA G2445 N2-methylase RlmL